MNIIEKPIKNHDNYIVKAVRGTNKKKKVIWGDLFKGYTSLRIFLVGKTTAGKSTIVYNLLNHIVSNLTHLVVISESASIDLVTKKIISKYDKILPEVIVYEKLNENTLNSAISKMTDIVKEFRNENDEEEEPIDPSTLLFMKINKMPIPEKKVKEKKKEYDIIFPYCMTLIDDCPRQQLRRPYIYSYIKRSRHMGSLILCSQYFNDIDNSARNQMTHFILMKGISTQKLKQIHEEICGHISFNEFIEYYDHCCSFPYSFMLVDDKGTIKRNLNIILRE